MSKIISLPAGAALFAFLAIVAVLGVFAFSAAPPAEAQGSPPGAPTGLMAKAVGVAGTDVVELSWTAPVAGRDSITGYKIETSVNDGGAWTDSVENTEADGADNAGSGVQTYYAVDAAVGKNLYRVSAINSVGTGDPSGRASVTPPVDGTQPDAPGGLTVMANGSREINLSWTAVPTANQGSGPVTQYKIEYSKDGMLPWMDLATTTVTSTNDGNKYSNTGLAPDTTRYYRVSAVNIAGRGPATDGTAMGTTTLAGVPAAPTGLTAKAVATGATGTDAVELSWTAPSAGGAPITGYKIETSVNDGGTWTDSVENTEDASGDPAGDNATISGVQTYHAVDAAVGKNLYRVSAMNVIGMGPVSATVSVTPPVAGTQPDAPASVAALKDGTNQIEVTWPASTTTGVGPVTQYKIEYSKDGMLPWMDLATVAGSALKYENTGLAPETTRYYRVSAVNKAGQGPATDGTATATTDGPGAATSEPGKPTGLMAKAVGVAGTDVVELSWTAPVAGRDSITGYKIETSVNDGGAWTDSVENTEADGADNAGSGVQTYYAVDAAVGKNLYRVSAINSVGTGDPSATVSVTPPVDGTQPDAPGGLTVMANGSREINLSWTAVPTANQGSGPVTQYKIEYSKDGMLPWMDLATTTVTSTNDGNKYSNTGLAPDTTRYYRVSAVNIAGRGPATDGTAMGTTTLAGVPAAPTGLTAKAVATGATGTDAVELSWTAPSAGGAPITGYKIETSVNDGGTWTDSVENTEDASGDPAGDNATISGVQTYHAVDAAVGKNLYRVSAMNVIDMGPVSATVSVTPPVAGTQPDAPASVAARADGQNEIEVTWPASTTTGVGPVTQYKIEYSKDGMLPWMDLATVAGSALKYENTGLAPETTRYYRVSAVNKAGQGPVSPTPEVTDPNSADTDHAATTADAAADKMGTVTLSTQEPMVDRVITATLRDDDGMVSGQMWQWQKSMNKSSWMAATGTGAMTRSYTPVAMDESYYLRVTVTYTDKNRSDRIAQSMATDAVTLPADQMGTVTLSTQEPLVNMAITATLRDSDGTITAQMWQWEKSMDKSSWMDATGTGATTMSYTPAAMDVGYYLRATVSYTDKYRSDRMASSMPTGSKVVSNSAPVFEDGATTTRDVPENSPEGTNVGAPVMATDADAGDTLTYTLSGADAMYFTVDNMGQIKVGASAMLDYETKMSYMVTVTATDDSGASNNTASTGVTITVTNMDEDGTVTLDSEEPMVGTAVTATLTDLDMVTEDSVEWGWSRSMSKDGTFTHIDEDSMSYTPTDDDVGYYLKVTAEYTDGAGPDKSESATAAKVVPDPLVVRYDANGNREIEKPEVIKAINDYLFGEGDDAISKADMIKVINLYLFG